MRVLLLGAGRPVANSFARSLRIAKGYHIIGVCGRPEDLATADADETHLIPNGDKEYDSLLLDLISETRPHFAHSQSDEGVGVLSRLRIEIVARGPRLFLPPRTHVKTCHDKWESYLAWKEAGLPVPETVLGRAAHLPPPPVHVRPRWGGGGQDSLRRAGHDLATEWLENKTEPNAYTVAEHLPGGTVTWQAIYRGGALVASQLRRRLAWTNGDHGSARISETFLDREVEALGVAAVAALGGKPNGIYGVDMTLDAEDRAHLTEINIGRFFSTIDFFARCGLNMPDYYCRGAPLQESFSMQNPLEGQKWIRCMDREPVLVYKRTSHTQPPECHLCNTIQADGQALLNHLESTHPR